MWACPARFPLAHSILECIRAELHTDLTVFARVEPVAIRPHANRLGSAPPQPVRDRHGVSPAHRSPYAAADSASHAASHAAANGEAHSHPIAGEQVDPAWLTDE